MTVLDWVRITGCTHCWLRNGGTARKVIAFEPSPESVADCCDTCALTLAGRGRRGCALGAEPGEQDFVLEGWLRLVQQLATAQAERTDADVRVDVERLTNVLWRLKVDWWIYQAGRGGSRAERFGGRGQLLQGPSRQ